MGVFDRTFTMARRSMATAALALLLSAAAPAAAARFRLASHFQSLMVLQRDAAAPIWGWATPGQDVFLGMLNGRDNSTIFVNGTAGSDGLFVLEVPPQPASLGPYSLVVSTAAIDDRCLTYAYSCGGATIQLVDIVFGDVILCTGQSNMQVNVGFAFNASYELNWANAYGGLVRIVEVAANSLSAAYPLDDIPQFAIPWSYASNTTLPEFSATCWYTAKAMLEQRPAADSDVALGLVTSCWGGTAIRAWTPADVWQQCEPLYPFPDHVGGGSDCGMDHAPCQASGLYNAMLAPLTVGPMKISSAIWFQGENDQGDVNSTNANYAYPYYSCQLQGLANALRTNLGSPNAHWTTVQLAPYLTSWSIAPFRQMQHDATAKLSNATAAPLFDDGDPLSPIGSVHSRNKQLVGQRVARGILNALYGQDFALEGPTYESAVLSAAPDGSMLYANVSLLNVAGGGLTYVPPHVNPWSNSSRCPTELFDAKYCGFFSIGASDGELYNATSVTLINGGTGLQLAAPVVPAQPGIRAASTSFGWNAWPVVNYYGTASGLPLVPWNATA